MPEQELIDACASLPTAAPITLTEDVDEAVAGAHVVYTDIWVSMGEPDDIWEERIRLLEPYRVTSAVMAKAASDAIFMHCLPSYHLSLIHI